MTDKHKKLLDEWWNTEPFGYDNSDTYAGIVKLLEVIEAEKAEAEHVLNVIWKIASGAWCDGEISEKAWLEIDKIRDDYVTGKNKERIWK